MAGSSFGELFRFTTWGESHGPAIGVVVDGVPSRIPLAAAEIQHWLDRRKPGQSKFTTQRREPDRVEILSGVFEGVTTGTPVSLMIRNEDQRSKDYGEIKDLYRPGHADITYDAKYGIRDYRGGGRVERPRDRLARRGRRHRPQDPRARRQDRRLSRPDRRRISSIAIGSTWPRSSATRSGARTPPRRSAGRRSSTRSARPARRWVP